MAIGFSTYLLSEEELKLGEEVGKAYWSGNHKFGVINNSAPDETKNYQIKAKDGKCWKKVHLELMGSGSHTSSVPIRQISCKNERTHSETTGSYELTKIEADTLKSHPDIEWVQLDPEFHEEARIPVELHSINRFGKNVKNYRNLSKENNTPSTPTEVANSLIATTGSPNWIKVSDSHPNTPAMNYWGVICQDLKDYAIYPSAPANANDQDPLRESIQTVSNAVTCSSAGHYQLQVWADGEWAGCMVENIATGFKLENNDSKFKTLSLDERGRGHFHEIINLGYLSASTQLQITCKVRNGTFPDPNKRNWANNPGGIGWKLLHLGYVTTTMSGGAFPPQPLTHAFPSGTSASIPSSEDNRTNYGGLRMSTAGTNPWSSDPNTVVNSDIAYDNDGTDIDLIIVDTGTWTGHPEFCTNDKDPQNFIRGNVLSRSGKSGVLDLALDAPYYLDPEWFDADPSSRLITRWDGTIVPDEATARNWWFSSVLRSSTFNTASTSAGTGTFSITIPANYTRAANCGTDTTLPTVNDHGTKCGGVAYGKNFGKAFNCNKWAICAIDMSTKVPTESAWTMQKIFHKTKPDNPKFSGNSTKNPTVSSNSWGYGSAYVGFFVSGMERVKYNYQGTEASFPNRPTTDVYGNTYSQYPDGPGSGFDYNSYSNPWVTNIPAFARTSSRNALISTGYYSFGYYWKMSPHLRAENTEEPREGFAAEYNAALEAVNSGIHFCNSAGNDQNYFVTKDDPNYDNWISRLEDDGTIKGVAGDNSSHAKVYPNRSSYPSQLAYDATGLNTILSVGAMDDRYNSNYPFTDHSADPKHDSGTVDSNFTGDKLESMAMGGPRGTPVGFDFGATINYEDYPFWKDRFSGWYFGGKQSDGGFYSCKGSAVDFFAPADGMLSACGSSNTIVSNNNSYVTRNDDIPASWNSSTQAYLDGWFDGTSSACPALAGTIACVLQQNRTTSPVHLKSYLKAQISDATSFFNGYKPSSNNPNDPLWLLPNSNMGDPIKVIKEVTSDTNTPNACYTASSGIDATRNLNERYTVTSASGVTIMIRGIKEFSSSDVSIPSTLRVKNGYYPVYTTHDMTSTQAGLIKFRIKSGSNDQILEVSDDGGSSYNYFTVRVVSGNFNISRQGLIYYYLNKPNEYEIEVADETPTYILSTNSQSYNEGGQIITTVQTGYVAQGTVLYWSLSGTGITSDDFSSGSLTGQVTINAQGTAVFNHTLANDLTTEGTETVAIKLFSDSSRNTQVATTSATINDTSKGSTYAIAPSNTSVDEGSSLIYGVGTSNVADGATLYWSLSGTNITADDFSPSSLTGSGTISNNGFSVTKTVVSDLKTEGVETVVFKLFTDSARTNEVASNSSVTIQDTSTTPAGPGYTITPNKTTLDEGDTIIFTVATTNVPENTTLHWQALADSGSVDVNDFGAGEFQGSAQISSGGFNITQTIANDITTEGTDKYTIVLYPNNTYDWPSRLAQSEVVTINDTSVAASTYSITPSPAQIDEGGSFTTTVNTLNVDEGTVLYWRMEGTGIDANDFSSGSLTGSGTVNALGTFNFSHTAANDTTTESSEEIRICLYGDSARTIKLAETGVLINDTSQSPTPTYAIQPDKTEYIESETVSVRFITSGVAAGTTLHWKMVPTGANPIDAQSGGSNGTTNSADFDTGPGMWGSANVQTPAPGLTNDGFSYSWVTNSDQLTEGDETFKIEVYSTYSGGNWSGLLATSPVCTIKDTSTAPGASTYTLTANTNPINEGEYLGLTVTTTNVANGTVLYWEYTGVTSGDFNDGALDGSVTIPPEGTKSWGTTIKADTLTEGSETLTVKLYSDSARTTQVGSTLNITINDTSIGSEPTYTLSTTDTRFNEGDSFTTTVTTTNVDDNTVLYWALSGTGISEDDFNLANTVTGSGTVTSNTFTFSHTIKEDVTTEGDEVISIKLYSDSGRTTQVGNTLSVTIRDTSQPGYSIRVTAPNNNEYIITGTDRNGSI